MTDYDVVIVGASVAGCATAALLGQQGLSVALLERSTKPDHYQHLCTHEVVALGNEALRRMGVLEQLRALGTPGRTTQMWTRYGWIQPPRPGVRHDTEGLNVRRQTMDPVLRQVAAATPGVDLHLGATVTDLTYEQGRVAGVQLRTQDGTQQLAGRVVVAADGKHSTIAKLLGADTKYRPHARFGYAGYFEGLTDESGDPRIWLLDPDVAYSFPTDGGLTLLAVAPVRSTDRIAAFKADIDGEFRRIHESLPNGHDMSRAKLVGKYRGLIETRNYRRQAAGPGFALVGDAAQLTDFVWGTGCGFALASGLWLADHLGPALAGSADNQQVDRALKAYERHHRRALEPHYNLIASYSTARNLSRFERMLFKAAAKDAAVARAVRRMGQRTTHPARVVAPVLGRTIVRAALPATRSATSAAAPAAAEATPGAAMAPGARQGAGHAL